MLTVGHNHRQSYQAGPSHTELTFKMLLLCLPSTVQAIILVATINSRYKDILYNNNAL